MIFQNSPRIKPKTALRILKISAIFLTIIILFFGNFHQSFAASTLEDIYEALKQLNPATIMENIKAATLESVSIVSGFFFYLLGAISATILTLGGYLLDLGLDLNQKIISNPVASEGFKIVLSVVNLLFILAIIVIAFATILRYAGYDIKKLLPKLIIAAVLINFSLTLAGLVLDFTGVFSNFFIQGVAGNGESFSQNLVAPWEPHKLLLEISHNDVNFVSGGMEFSKALLGIITRLFFVTLFTLIMAVVILTIAFMVFVRYIALVILVILMPLAWILWVVPETAHLSRKWWNEFLKWNFFLPAVTFFFYLSIFLFSKSEQFSFKMPLKYYAAETGDILSPVIENFGNMVVITGLLIGGLLAAQKFGIYGANAAMAYVTKIKNGAIGVAGKIGKATATPITVPTKAVARGTANLLNNKYLRWIPGAKTAIPKLNVLGSKKAEAEEYQKKYLSGLTPEQFEYYQKTTPLGTLGAIAKAATTQESLKRDKLSGLTAGLSEEKAQERIRGFAAAAQAIDPSIVKEIAKTNALLYAQLTLQKNEKLGEKLKELTGKISNKELLKQSANVFSNPEFLNALDDRQREYTFKNANRDQLKNLVVGVEKIFGDLKAEETHPMVELALQNPITQKIIRETQPKDLGLERFHLKEQLLKQKSNEEAEKLKAAEGKPKADQAERIKDVQAKVRNVEEEPRKPVFQKPLKLKEEPESQK